VPDLPRYSPLFEFKDVDRFFGRNFDIFFNAFSAPFQSRAPPID
jgi:hypothetical protein